MRTSWQIVVVGCSVFLSAAILHAQNQGPDPAQMEKMWKEFATPGEPHAHFKELAGMWSVQSTDYMMNPTSPVKATGEAKFETMMDGRFLVQHYKSEMGGQPFEGMGITGYDNAKKKYVGSWMDNMSTSIMQTEGTADPATKTMTEFSEMSSPMGPMKLKMVTKHDGPNQFTFTMFMMTPDGKESKAMELVYTRRRGI